MSTKVTITHGDTFHLYEECYENDHVWLQIEKTTIEVWANDSNNAVTIAIPVKVWRKMVQGWLNSSWADDLDRDNRPIELHLEGLEAILGETQEKPE